MDKIIEKFNKISLLIIILISSIILGGFYFASQIIKQKSIERQQEIKRIQECYDKEKYNTEYYYDKQDNSCKIRDRKKSLEEIFR